MGDPRENSWIIGFLFIQDESLNTLGHMEHLLQITLTKRDGSTYHCKKRVCVVEDG